jgi:hypothetical protein
MNEKHKYDDTLEARLFVAMVQMICASKDDEILVSQIAHWAIEDANVFRREMAKAEAATQPEPVKPKRVKVHNERKRKLLQSVGEHCGSEHGAIEGHLFRWEYTYQGRYDFDRGYCYWIEKNLNPHLITDRDRRYIAAMVKVAKEYQEGRV